MNTKQRLVLALLVAFPIATTAASSQRRKPPVPDLIAGGVPDRKHDWNLGPTDARGSQLRLPKIFADHMVLQRDRAARIWGVARPGATVEIRFAEQARKVVTAKTGAWHLELAPIPASAEGRTLTVKSESHEVVIRDVLVGDVWVLGGQSNMEASLANIQNGELEILAANRPAIRLMTIPLRASPTPLDDFAKLNEYNSWTKKSERKGEWRLASPESVQLFAAVGYVFGRRIHEITRVPIGLIDTSWGGTTVEAWISRETLRQIPDATPLLASWDDRIASYDPAASLAQAVKRWEGRAARLRKEGKQVPPKPSEPRPSPAFDRNNPGAAYNAILLPIAGLSVKGALFYQGINNAVGGARPKLYAQTFAELVPEWRRLFRDPDMPFGICQMVSWGFPPKVDATEVEMISTAPYIREAQLVAHRRHANTGFVVAYDLGHIQMHSPYKVPLGERLARWALATQYGKKVTYRTPLYQSMETKSGTTGKEIIVRFDQSIHPRHGGRARIEGFAIAGADRHFYPADAYLAGADRVRVSSGHVPEPIAVRYAWATHPAGTLVGAGSNGLPAAPFRTDRFDWPDAPFAARGSEEDRAHRQWMKEQRTKAEVMARRRRAQDATVTIRKEGGKDKRFE